MSEQDFQNDNSMVNEEGVVETVESVKEDETFTKKRFDLSWLFYFMKKIASKFLGIFQKAEKNKWPASEVNKAASKISVVANSIQNGFVKAVKTIVSQLKQTCANCHRYLKEKELVKKIKENKALSFITGGGSIVLLFTLIIYFLTHSHSNQHRPNAYNNLLRINTVQSELSKLQLHLTTTSQIDNKQKIIIENKLQDIDKKLNDMSQGGSADQQKQIENLRATIQSSSVGLFQKVNALNTEVNQLKKKIEPAPTLSPKALPFVVQDIDTWNGKPFAQIAQKANSTMVSYVGLYQRSGLWKEIEINAPEQTVTFINAKGQVVHVQVKQF